MAAALLLLAAPMAQVTGDEPGAREAAQVKLREGNRFFRDGNYGDALRAYREAHARFPSPKLFFNLARCEDKLRQRASAMDHYSRFLKDVSDVEHDVRIEAETRMGMLAGEVTAIELTGAPAGATIALDGQPAELAASGESAAGTLWVEPGRHQLSVAGSTGAPWTIAIDANPGARLSISVPTLPLVTSARQTGGPSLLDEPSVQSKQTPGPLVRVPNARPFYRRWWFWAGVGAVVLTAGVVAYTATRLECPPEHCVAPWGP